MARKPVTRKQELVDACARVGLYVRTYSPGDGVTRYRFFVRDTDPAALDPESNSYFGPRNGIYTALGITAAEDYVSGYAAAYYAANAAQE